MKCNFPGVTLSTINLKLTFSSLATILTFRASCHFGLKVIGQKNLHIPCMYIKVIYCVVCLESIYIYTLLKLIQMRAEDNQRWQQIQNLMPSPRQHIPEQMVMMAYCLKGLNCALECRFQMY